MSIYYFKNSGKNHLTKEAAMSVKCAVCIRIVLILSMCVLFTVSIHAQTSKDLLQGYWAGQTTKVRGHVSVSSYTAKYEFVCSINKYRVTGQNKGTTRITVDSPGHDNAWLKKMVMIYEGTTLRDSSYVYRFEDSGDFNITSNYGTTVWEHTGAAKTNLKVYLYSEGWVCPLEDAPYAGPAPTGYVETTINLTTLDTLGVPQVPQDFQCDNPTAWGNYPAFSWDSSVGAQSYKIYKKKNAGSYSLLATLNGHNNTSYTDYGLTLESIGDYDTYYYKVAAHNNNGDSGYTNEVSITALAFEKRSNAMPKEFSLEQNYPNPFNPTTEISFHLPEASHVSLIIYDLRGTVVKQLINGHHTAGSRKVLFDASNLASGVYFYRITAGKYFDVKKMVLIK